jgi:hypothetical protein
LRALSTVVAAWWTRRDDMTEAINPGDDAAPGTPGTGEDVCPRCGGTGTIEDGECVNCGGTGKVIEGIGGA